MLPAPLAVPLLVLVGLAAGSFLTVCIRRLPEGGSVITPRSHCPTCGHIVRWRDNVPVISYLVLGGRCRDCGARISAMYPAVEIATPLLFLLQYALAGFGPPLASRLVFTSMLVVLFVTDLRHRLLPDVITIRGAVVGLVAAIWLPPGWIDALIGALGGLLLLLAIRELYWRIRGHEGLAYGDAKMLGLVGAFLGWRLMLVSAVFAFLLGAAVGLALIAAGRAGPRTELPFGSFLAVAAIIAMAVGDRVLAWYLAFY
ncbi:MAG: prepilin peptidase [Acidobacteria bacterium]|nr:prepilin peptidase [Acidobacteriota bacterium]